MKAIPNFDQVQESGDFKTLPAGGYIIRFEAVDELVDKEYFQCVYDIAEGENKGFYGDEWGKAHEFAHMHRASYKETARGMFKHFLACIDKSNRSNLVDKAQKSGINSADLRGKLVGAVIGIELYTRNDGKDGERRVIRSFKPVEDIRSGNFQIPEPKWAKGSAPAQDDDPRKDFTQDDDIPF